MKDVTQILRMIAVIILATFLTGCGSGLEKLAQDFERGEDLIDSTRDLVRSTDRLARSGERLAQQTAETGRSINRLKKQSVCVEVKDASRYYNAKVRISGTDKGEKLQPTGYTRYRIPVKRFSEKKTFTVDLEQYDKDWNYIKTHPQTVNAEFSDWEMTDKGCGILYFVSEEEEIGRLVKPSEIEL